MAAGKVGQEQRSDILEQKSGVRAQESGASAEKLSGSERSGRESKVPVEKEREEAGMAQGSPIRAAARYASEPFATMQRITREMDELFDTFFYGRPTERTRYSRWPSLWAPDVELVEEADKFRVRVDLPGIAQDNIKVDVHQGILTIQGERREERAETDGQQGFRRSERRYGSFYRSIPLPEGAELEQAQATLKDGVLEITIPIGQPTEARQIEIKR